MYVCTQTKNLVYFVLVALQLVSCLRFKEIISCINCTCKPQEVPKVLLSLSFWSYLILHIHCFTNFRQLDLSLVYCNYGHICVLGLCYVFLLGSVNYQIVKEVMNIAYCMHVHEEIKATNFSRLHGKGKLRILPYDVYLNLTAYQRSAFNCLVTSEVINEMMLPVARCSTYRPL